MEIKMELAICPEHGVVEEYEPDEFGMDYFQAVGECMCGAKTYKENGEPTAEVVIFKKVIKEREENGKQ